MVSQNLHKQKFDQERNTQLKQKWFQAVWLTVAAPQPFYTKAIKIYRSAMCFLLHVGVKQPNVKNGLSQTKAIMTWNMICTK